MRQAGRLSYEATRAGEGVTLIRSNPLRRRARWLYLMEEDRLFSLLCQRTASEAHWSAHDFWELHPWNSVGKG
jgi:hypothetical protein